MTKALAALGVAGVALAVLAYTILSPAFSPLFVIVPLALVVWISRAIKRRRSRSRFSR